MAKIITRTVWILSLVSLFADVASEMLYPIMPLFLAQVGFGAIGLGILEGIAEFVSGLGKAFFGSLSDQWDRRNGFIRLGYGLSAIGKPLMGLFPSLGGVFGGRTLDRMGKGMRGAARDALLIAESAPEHRGRVFGFHRAMDTLGAVIGPLLALLLLAIWPGQYAWLFVLAAVPGAISVGLTFLLKREKPIQATKLNFASPFKGIWGYWRKASPTYKRLVLVFLVFGLANSSDLFLLLRAKEMGVGEVEMVAAYVFYNLIYALASYPLGNLADKMGFRNVFLGALMVYAGVYFGLGFNPGVWGLFALFGLYGIFSAGSESIAKAWLSLYVPKDAKATGMGLFQFLQTVVKLVASPATGLLWFYAGGDTAFWVIALWALAAFLLSLLLLPGRDRPR